MSTYSTSLKLELIGAGEQAGTWGNTTNTNWNLIQQAVAGVQAITMANANFTLTSINGTLDEARNAVLVVGGTNSAIRQIIAPLAQKVYIVTNNTVGGFAITIGNTSGLLATIPNGNSSIVYCDGTNFYNATSANNILGNLVVNGSVTGTNFIGPGTGLTGTASALSIGGNAATATSATTATTATTANALNTSNAYTGTTFTATTQFSGPGTGLTGTAASLSIGGNAISATNATRITNSGGWSVTPTGTKLFFNYNGTDVGSLDSAGNFIALTSVTAGATP